MTMPGARLAYAALLAALADTASAPGPETDWAPTAALQLTMLPAAPSAGEAVRARLSLVPPAGWTLVRTTPLHVAIEALGPWRAQRAALTLADAQPAGAGGLELATTLVAEAPGSASVAMQARYYLCAGRRCRRANSEQRAEVTIAGGAEVGEPPLP